MFSSLIHANPTVTTMHWSLLERGLIKLNIDGALPSYRSGASIGDTIFKVEARAVLQGLQIAWENRYIKHELECNNALLVELILAGGIANSKLGELRLIHYLLKRDWKVRFRHVSRSQNKVAGHMAKTASSGLSNV
ncbi:hypothetical protein PVK06_018225 [Gossypium arboreum]|uniref:RNase H type-1 domain-containing protein n=1 Tax=Gossypium arboreum TaxID=29729 RepID=A0ABR0Q5U5_GOSAR|nr:hypothetical protein PVK06_018225 [Gossypium arboreum]